MAAGGQTLSMILYICGNRVAVFKKKNASRMMQLGEAVSEMR